MSAGVVSGRPRNRVPSDMEAMLWFRTRRDCRARPSARGAGTGRLSAPSGGSQVTLGGQSIDFSALPAGTGDALRSVAGALGAEHAAEDDEPLTGLAAWPADRARTWEHSETAGGAMSRTLTGRELLLGSSFHLAAGGGEAGDPGFAAWGRVTVGGFDAEAPADNGTVRLDGEVTTGVLGADAHWERWLAGVALSVSEGEGKFDQPGVDSGTIESTLTSVNPYVRYEVSERVSAWGLLGYGTGDMTMTQAARDERVEIVTRTDLTMRLGAVGARGALLEAGEAGGLDLALRGDAFLVQMESAAAANTVATKADASRLRLVLEGSRAFALGESAVLTPGLEVGLRHDGGDAETGTGVEVGGRIRYADTGSGLTVEANARALIAHEDSSYEEWGAGGSVRLDPGASGRGLSFSLAPVWGTPSSGVDRLWSARDAAGLAPGGEFEAERRLESEIGYGFGAFGERGLVTPYAGLGFPAGRRRRRSHPPDGPQHPADDVRFLGEAGIGRIVRVGGDQTPSGRPGLTHRLDPLDHEAIAVPQHGHLAGCGDTPGGVDDEPVACAHLGLHRVAAQAQDAQALGVRIGLVADHAFGQIPTRLLYGEFLVQSSWTGGGFDFHLGDRG